MASWTPNTTAAGAHLVNEQPQVQPPQASAASSVPPIVDLLPLSTALSAMSTTSSAQEQALSSTASRLKATLAAPEPGTNGTAHLPGSKFADPESIMEGVLPTVPRELGVPSTSTRPPSSFTPSLRPHLRLHNSSHAIQSTHPISVLTPPAPQPSDPHLRLSCDTYKPTQPHSSTRRAALPSFLSPCQSAPTNILQMFASSSTDSTAAPPRTGHSFPYAIRIGRSSRDIARGPPPGKAPATATAPAATSPWVAPLGRGCSASTSGNNSCMTWPSLDHESICTATTPSGIAQDFQELLQLYRGLVRELGKVGVGVVHELGAPEPSVYVSDATALRAFAGGEAPAAALAASCNAADREEPGFAPATQSCASANASVHRCPPAPCHHASASLFLCAVLSG